MPSKGDGRFADCVGCGPESGITIPQTYDGQFWRPAALCRWCIAKDRARGDWLLAHTPPPTDEGKAA